MKNNGKIIGYTLWYGSNIIMFIFWFNALSDWIGFWGKVLSILLVPGVVVFPIIYWIVEKTFPLTYFILWGISWIGLLVVAINKRDANRKSIAISKIRYQNKIETNKFHFDRKSLIKDQFPILSSFTDPQDGNIYKTVKIGDQIWLAENLNAKHFSNGDPIIEAKKDWEWEKAGSSLNPAWCFYNDDPINGKNYGKLYNWYAVFNPRGLAPKGWHIPTDQEWIQLKEYLGIEDCISKMKSTCCWVDKSNGTNKSGFSGLPSGSRGLNGDFSGLGREGSWWSTIDDKDWAWVFSLVKNNIQDGRNYSHKRTGYAVRCIKNN